MALVARASGDLPQARQYLGEALCVAAPVHDYETFMFQMVVVLAMALLLADEDQGERAVELYATASRYLLRPTRGWWKTWQAGGWPPSTALFDFRRALRQPVEEGIHLSPANEPFAQQATRIPL